MRADEKLTAFLELERAVCIHVLKTQGESQKIMVVAWAVKAKPGHAESCNCDLPSVADNDTHIVLVDPHVNDPSFERDEIHSVTAEFTPRVRLNHPYFTTKELSKKIREAEGKLLVRVTGLLMFDSKHHFEQDQLARATDWEIHPVFKLEYCSTGETCRANSNKNWKNLDKG